MEKDDEQYWVNAETEVNIWSTLQQALDDIRVPVVSPLFDLMDESEFPIQKVWQEKFATAVPVMMKRYGVENCLLGLLQEHPGGWHAEWFLFSKSPASTNILQQTWQVARLELPELLQNSIDRLGVSLAKGVPGKVLATDLAPSESTEEEASEPTNMTGTEAILPKNPEDGTQIAISGIQNGTQYAEVLSYLKNMSTGVQVEIVRIAPEFTVFKLKPAIDRETVLRKIYQDALLIEDTRIRSPENTATDQSTVGSEPDPTIYVKLMEVEKL